MSEQFTGSQNEEIGFLEYVLQKTESGLMIGFTITLFVAGGVVSGKVISRSQLTLRREKLLAQHIANATEEEKARRVKDAEEGLARKAGAQKQPPQVIYLDEAGFLSGEEFYEVGLWRGRVEMIAGYSFGTVIPGDMAFVDSEQ